MFKTTCSPTDVHYEITKFLCASTSHVLLIELDAEHTPVSEVVEAIADRCNGDYFGDSESLSNPTEDIFYLNYIDEAGIHIRLEAGGIEDSLEKEVFFFLPAQRHLFVEALKVAPDRPAVPIKPKEGAGQWVM